MPTFPDNLTFASLKKDLTTRIIPRADPRAIVTTDQFIGDVSVWDNLSKNGKMGLYIAVSKRLNTIVEKKAINLLSNTNKANIEV
jgi:hypothetical protein